MAAARLYLVSQETTKAAELLEKVVAAKPRELEAAFLLAACYYQLDEIAKAEPLLFKLSTRAPREPQILSLYGQVLLRQENLPAAKTALRRMVA